MEPRRTKMPAVSSDPNGQQADDSGDIDPNLLDYLQSLTPLERLERHQQALELVRALRDAGRRRHGLASGTAEEPE